VLVPLRLHPSPLAPFSIQIPSSTTPPITVMAHPHRSACNAACKATGLTVKTSSKSPPALMAISTAFSRPTSSVRPSASGSASSFTIKPTRLTSARSDRESARPSLLSIMAVTARLWARARPSARRGSGSSSFSMNGLSSLPCCQAHRPPPAPPGCPWCRAGRLGARPCASRPAPSPQSPGLCR